jgi:polyisoprenoid-binding protein YceI
LPKRRIVRTIRATYSKQRVTVTARVLARCRWAVLSLAVWGPVSGAALAADASWSVTAGDLRVLVPLKPGGAFEAKSTALSGTVGIEPGRPLAVTGEIALDLATVDTGISLRNEHLRDKYLQIARGAGFDKAVLSSITLADATGPEFEGRSAFAGTLLLHGVTHPVSGAAEFRRVPQGVRVEASFPLVLTDHGVEPPMYLGVGVAAKVMVKVMLVAAPTKATP